MIVAARPGPAPRTAGALASPAAMDRPVRLIVDPSAGAGRAARLRPRVEAALRVPAP